ncbi:cytochrome c oxidase accessory protein CcoG [Pelomonas sp. UHG3]|uniref:Cytochrome c oxidase accessory protein CcoG n=1 Tax=Roseateles hydrophilus TaxID=2975054 RepID=A0ACC6CG29_9BURK|nr:cytochrome c oxidase accessory protein CcoG [Pelomonas sp. UHG3]MCY4747245.1 cytochrome c oxidase accessory protein CcoG [Pelomonas sp. UHG3]
MSSPAAPGPGDATQVIRLYRSEDKIQPRSVDGFYARWRWAIVALTQLVFYGLPWLGWGDRPAVLFDLEARRFYVFALVLYPQDFVYLTALLMISAYALFLFTAVAGRLWCGYACPQTVYTEIFMKVERWFEGDRNARLKLDKAPWSLNKLWRKSGKQAVWIAIGLWTGFTFVGYFTPIRTLGAEVLALGLGPWETFWVLFYGFATYGNAGYMREQVCKYMCPYARFQSAMFDRDTLIVSYDPVRGEPRGNNAKRKKGDERTAALGDCIDCGLCVQVCPTGIDIRDGLQYECIGCAACVDVCNGVMDKMGTPRGLVRYDTENGLEQRLEGAQRWRRVLRPRVLIYGGVLLLICTALLWSLLSRHSFRVDIVRDRASLARLVEDGWVENVYRLQIMNATEAPQRYRLEADGLPGLVLSQATTVDIGPAEARWVAVGLRLPPEIAQGLKSGAHPVHWRVVRLGDAAEAVNEKSTFVVPR